MNVETARIYAELSAAKKAKEAEVKELSKRMATIENSIREDMTLNGVQNLPLETTAGRQTVYLHSQHWASPAEHKDKGDVCDALQRCGLPEYVQRTYNTQSLSAYVREQLREGRELPPLLMNAIEVKEVVKVRVRKAASSAAEAKQTTRETLARSQESAKDVK